MHNWFGDPEITYWIDRDHWGKGVATSALLELLEIVEVRPLYARVAFDNQRSRRVLDKCGFIVTGRESGFANARGARIDLILD